MTMNLHWANCLSAMIFFSSVYLITLMLRLPWTCFHGFKWPPAPIFLFLTVCRSPEGYGLDFDVCDVIKSARACKGVSRPEFRCFQTQQRSRWAFGSPWCLWTSNFFGYRAPGFQFRIECRNCLFSPEMQTRPKARDAYVRGKQRQLLSSNSK